MIDATGWDDRYRGAAFVWTTEPNRFLAPEVSGLRSGRALDLACGEGRNAVWLATQGWEVTGIDFSRVGLDKAVQLGAANDVTCEWLRGDVTRWRAEQPYNLVIVFYLQLPRAERTSAFAGAACALAPGATLLIVGHDLTNLTDGFGGPQNPDVLYTPDDVRDDLVTAGVADLVIERAERVKRPVTTDAGPRVAIDTLVRAHRPTR